MRALLIYCFLLNVNVEAQTPPSLLNVALAGSVATLSCTTRQACDKALDERLRSLAPNWKERQIVAAEEMIAAAPKDFDPAHLTRGRADLVPTALFEAQLKFVSLPRSRPFDHFGFGKLYDVVRHACRRLGRSTTECPRVAPQPLVAFVMTSQAAREANYVGRLRALCENDICRESMTAFVHMRPVATQPWMRLETCKRCARGGTDVVHTLSGFLSWFQEFELNKITSRDILARLKGILKVDLSYSEWKHRERLAHQSLEKLMTMAMDQHNNEKQGKYVAQEQKTSQAFRSFLDVMSDGQLRNETLKAVSNIRRCFFLCRKKRTAVKFLAEANQRRQWKIGVALTMVGAMCPSKACVEAVVEAYRRSFSDLESSIRIANSIPHVVVDPGYAIIFLVIAALVLSFAVVLLVIGRRAGLLKAMPSLTLIFALISVACVLRVTGWAFAVYTASAFTSQPGHIATYTIALLNSVTFLALMCYMFAQLVFLVNWIEAYHGELSFIPAKRIKVFKWSVIGFFLVAGLGGFIFIGLAAAVIRIYFWWRVPLLVFVALNFALSAASLVYTVLTQRKMVEVEAVQLVSLKRMRVLFIVLLAALSIALIMWGVEVGLRALELRPFPFDPNDGYNHILWGLGRVLPETMIAVAIMIYILLAWRAAAGASKDKDQDSNTLSLRGTTDESLEPLMPKEYDF